METTDDFLWLTDVSNRLIVRIDQRGFEWGGEGWLGKENCVFNKTVSNWGIQLILKIEINIEYSKIAKSKTKQTTECFQPIGLNLLVLPRCRRCFVIH